MQHIYIRGLKAIINQEFIQVNEKRKTHHEKMGNRE